MSESKNILPQEGTAKRRESLPTKVGCPADSGGGNNPIHGATPVPEQAAKERIELLQRKSRSNSIGIGVGLGIGTKRKTLDTSIDFSNPEPYKRKTSPEAFALNEALEMITKLATDLDSRIEQNTRREIKEISKRLTRQIQVINSASVKKWREQHRYEKDETERMTYDVDIQTDKLLTDTTNTDTQTPKDWLESAKPGSPKKEAETQTPEEWLKSQPTELCNCKSKEDALHALPQISTVDDYKLIEHKVWEKKCFTNTEVVIGNPLDTEIRTVKVTIVDSSDAKMEVGIKRLFKNRYPDIELCTETFEVLEQHTSIKSKTNIKNPVQKVVKITANSKEELWANLIKLRTETEKDKCVALHHLDRMSNEAFRKMVETIFHGTETKITIFTTSQKENVPNLDNRKKTQAPSYALIVEKGQENIKDVLSRIKEVVKDSSDSNIIKTVSTTKDGNLLIRTETNEGAINNLKQAIGKTLKGDSKVKINIRDNMSKDIIHIRGMDLTSDRSEVLAAIENITGELRDDQYRLSDLRPNANGTQAVTLSINTDLGENLLSHGTLKIGLVRCSVEKRIEVRKCPKCWSFEHSIENCEEQDRANKCFNCGGENHKAKDCQNPEFCINCKVGGHSCRSGKCPAFKEALHIARKAQRGVTFRRRLVTEQDHEDEYGSQRRQIVNNS